MFKAIRRLVAALLVCASQFGLAEDRRTDKDRLSVMTINTLFMWDGVAPEDGSSQIGFPWRGNPEAAAAHMAEIAQLIKATNPDIVNLVEVEGLEALSTLNDEFLQGYGYRPFFVQGADTFTGQDVCMLSRIDPAEFGRDDRTATSGTETKGVSKNYFATFDLDEKKVAMVGLHFLARPDDASRRDERQAQAKVIARKAHELVSEGHSVIVLGDFNDYDSSAESRDHIGSTPITNVLSTIRELDAFDSGDDLTNVASRVPQSSRFTAFWDQDEDGQIDEPHELTSIDHILVSPALAGCITGVVINQGFDPDEVTDHFPITVQFDISELDTTTPGTPVPPPSHGNVVISRLLPNAAGDESENEAVWLRNPGSMDVDLTGWRLRDQADRTWVLARAGTLTAGEEKKILRAGDPMALTNTGDTIVLLDPGGNEVDSVAYGPAAEGVEIWRAQDSKLRPRG